MKKNILSTVFIVLAFFSIAHSQVKSEAYAKGLNLFFLGQYQPAIIAFSDAITDNPNEYNAYLYRGQCYAYLHHFKEAKLDFDIVALKLRNNEDLCFGYGYLYNEMGEYKKAIPYLDKAITINPKYALAYNTRGVSYQKLGKPRLAIENYTLAIKADSSLAIAYNNRGTAIYENQDIASATSLDIKTAIKDFDRAILLNPKLCISLANRGMAYGFLEKNDLALIDLDAAIACEPDNEVYYINRGNIYTKIGQYTRAISDFEDALRLNPKQTEALILMGIAKQKSGLLQDAVLDEMNAGIKDKRYKAITNYNIARFYAMDKDKRLAMKYLREARTSGYFKPISNLADFLKAPEFMFLKNDADFEKFRAKVRGNRI